MAALRIDTFGGVAPLIDPKKLPEWGAQAADSCVFDAGDLRPLRSAQIVQWGGAIPALPSRIYQWRGRWITWSGDVDVAASPVTNDQFQRLYWTRGAGLRPRFAINDELNSNTDATSIGTDLGMIGPTNAPDASAAGNEIPSVQATEIAQTSPARVSTAVDHPFSNGQRVVVALARVTPANPQYPNDPPTPPDRTGMAEINGLECVVKLVENAAGLPDTRSFDLIGANADDFSDYDASRWVATITRIYTDDDLDSRTYVYTYVSRFGEESQPSPPSEVVDVVSGTEVTVSVGITPTQISAGYTVRLYRSVTGTSGTTAFFFVKEAAAVLNLELVDDVQDVSLGELLPSETWAPPPLGLTGLVALPNGFFAGFIDNTLYFCEPYQPHAWPLQYTRTTQDKIVGLAVYGQTLVVATAGKPYLYTGTDPGSMSQQQLDEYAPALSKRSVASSGTGVIYPTMDGLVHVSGSGPRLMPIYFGKRKWGQLVAAGTRDAIWHDGRYLLAVGNVVWLFEPVSEDQVNVSRTVLNVNTWAVNTEVAPANPGVPRDTLHFVPVTSPPALLWVFDFASAVQGAVWASRTFVLPKPCSMACGQVFAASYPVTLQVHAARVDASGQPASSLAYPFGDTEAQTVVVSGPEPFRLAGGFMAREWRIDVLGQATVQGLVLASSMDELKQE
jgi:hypothetical protein